MEQLRPHFKTYGLDYDTTMARFMGDEGIYVRILGMLFADPNAEALKAALAAGDLPAAFQAAHALKGVAGNLGLTPLYQAACALVEPLRRGQRPEPEQYAALPAALDHAATFYGALKGAD